MDFFHFGRKKEKELDFGATGRVYVWGEQADGRCLHHPLLIEELNAIPIVRVLAGARHCVAISASGAVFTWGQNNSGELGMDDFRPQTSVHHINHMDGLGVVEAACGDNHTVLLTNSGRTFSFGSDALGQCGFGKKSVFLGSKAAVTTVTHMS
ncbi:hypothetical protein CAEBREN_08326 [Caenorhabditis brenneri]|uniref:Uncharacterized protein n=1 Tax=Caenorhabditis brenneri TaxID=135651 RepID=G0NU98_CAEBE|nr:hypothetical protein CAEBREN_08326 [Caenorhabditis brenneri]